MIRVGIVGYGNLGKATEKIVNAASDMEAVGIFSRRQTSSDLGTPCYFYSELKDFVGKIDVLALCGGSATDIPTQGRELIRMFNTVDSFDTHALIPEYSRDMDAAAKATDHLSVYSAGWDPGLFSLMRLMFESVLPKGNTYTFWGKGVSQGHSEAIRKLDGVKNGKQYTIPKEEALAAVRSGSNPELTVRDKHLRVCYVVAEDGADRDEITRQIVTMPNYFADYDTQVNFIDEETFNTEHSGIPHGGFVIRSGENNGTKHTMEFSLKLESNPDFTASVLVAYLRAGYKLYSEGVRGAKSIFEIPLSYAANIDINEAIAHLL